MTTPTPKATGAVQDVPLKFSPGDGVELTDCNWSATYYRSFSTVTWHCNPWSGRPRTEADIAADPFGEWLDPLKEYPPIPCKHGSKECQLCETNKCLDCGRLKGNSLGCSRWWISPPADAIEDCAAHAATVKRSLAHPTDDADAVAVETEQTIAILRRTADEIRSQNICGWGNAIDSAITLIQSLPVQVQSLSSAQAGSIEVSGMAEPVAWMTADGLLVQAVATDGSLRTERPEYAKKYCVPLYAIDDETREAMKVAIVYLNDALSDSDYAGDTPDEEVQTMWRTNSAALRKHIAVLERLTGEGE